MLRGPTAHQYDRGAPPPGYFNSGVLVADMDRWRTDQVSRTAPRMFHRYRQSLRSINQDILNVIFAGRWTALPTRWNKLIDHPGDDRFNRLDYLTRGQGIVHYVGRTKPWEPGFPPGPLFDLYGEHCGHALIGFPPQDPGAARRWARFRAAIARRRRLRLEADAGGRRTRRR